MSAQAPSNTGFSIGLTTLAGKAILTPSESLTYANCEALKKTLEPICAGHAPTVILDCRAVAYLDSEALELLVETHEKLRALRGELRLTHVNAVCLDILTATRLIHTLVVCDDINQAIKGG